MFKAWALPAYRHNSGNRGVSRFFFTGLFPSRPRKAFSVSSPLDFLGSCLSERSLATDSVAAAQLAPALTPGFPRQPPEQEAERPVKPLFRGCPWGLQFCSTHLEGLLCSLHPPYHPALPAPFTAKAGKDPFGCGRMGQSRHWEQCPSVAAGSVPLSASLLSCRHLRPKQGQKQANISHSNNPRTLSVTEQEADLKKKKKIQLAELTFAPKPGVTRPRRQRAREGTRQECRRRDCELRQHSKGQGCSSRRSGRLTSPCHRALSGPHRPEPIVEPIVARGQEGCGRIPAQATCNDQAGGRRSSEQTWLPLGRRGSHSPLRFKVQTRQRGGNSTPPGEKCVLQGGPCPAFHGATRKPSRQLRGHFQVRISLGLRWGEERH